jgi:ribonuclease P protein component
VGLVVGRQLGGSVQRHRLSRQLRAIARPILAEVPGGLDIVIRPTPIAASVSFQQLSTDVGEAIRAAYRKVSAGRAWESV